MAYQIFMECRCSEHISIKTWMTWILLSCVFCTLLPLIPLGVKGQLSQLLQAGGGFKHCERPEPYTDTIHSLTMSD